MSYIRCNLDFALKCGGRTVIRPVSGWLGSLFRGKPQKESTVEEQDSSTLSTENNTAERLALPEELLEKFAKDNVENFDEEWRTASLGNIDVKGKILCSFENTFKRSIPNQALGTINTFTDLLNILEKSSHQPPTSTPKIYPNIRDDKPLPPNLSIQFINTGPKPKPYRQAFQNYDARRPEHANFLTKQQKEERKRKRRHLTAWK